MKKIMSLITALLVAQILSGCATVHRYPAYRGKVLELGTDKPIEGAGVLAVYRLNVYYWIEHNTEYMGYQAVLTDNTGRFEVPPKYFSKFRPLSSFDPDVEISIYKRGYGNFPGSFPFYGDSPGVTTKGRGGKTSPLLKYNLLPPFTTATFWLPKLETEEEIKEHDWAFSPMTSSVLDEKEFPPLGTSKGQFLPSKYTGEGR